jgi:hypothetical protein
MLDFTVHKYIRLLDTLIEQGYHFQTFSEYLQDPSSRCIILRHDVDKRPQNSLALAKIEHKFGLKGTYNFRVLPVSWNEAIIKEISTMGHEIGYHYENLSVCKGDLNKAFDDFRRNLENLRKLVPVSTITMHGSPKSKYDSKDLWQYFNYKELGIIGEPYFDIDFSKVLYLTDTGRRWDGSSVSIRDKVNAKKNEKFAQKGYRIHSTNDIITAAKEEALPEIIMFTIHPQRWHQNRLLWFKELIFQNIKNVVKRLLLGFTR